jgi:nitrile hydratase subunit beta
MSDTDDRDETHTKASFKPGDRVRVSTRFPVGHCAVPHYVRGKRGRVEAVIAPAAAINGQEELGESTRPKLCHYHIAIPLAELWPEYAGMAVDGLHAEVIETWLERT